MHTQIVPNGAQRLVCVVNQLEHAHILLTAQLLTTHLPILIEQNQRFFFQNGVFVMCALIGH